jgi:hypothetical protein
MERYGTQYVLDRDRILKTHGLDPVLDAAEHEEEKMQRFKIPQPEIVESTKIEKLLKTHSVSELIMKLLSHYHLLRSTLRCSLISPIVIPVIQTCRD